MQSEALPRLAPWPRGGGESRCRLLPRARMIETLPQQQKALPHSEESERAVLGGILLDPATLPVIAGRLRDEDFYLDRHQVLYRAMIDLQAEGVAIDLRTLQAKLEQQGKLE